MRFRPRRLAVGLGVAVVLLPVLGVIALHLPVVQRALVVRALSSLRTSADVDITVRTVSLSPTRLALVAEGVRVAAVQHPTQPLLEADRVEVDVARVVVTSLGRDIVIQRLVLDRPVVTLVRDAAGTWNLPRPSPEAPETASPAVTLGDIQLRNGRILVDDQFAGYRLDLTGLAVTTRDDGAFDTRADADVRVADTRLSGRIAGDVVHADDLVSVRDLRVRLARSQVTGNGSYDLQAGTLGLDAAFQLVAADAATLAGVPGLEGALSGTVQVTGTVDAPEAAWTLVGEGLTDGTIPPGRLTADGRADLTSVDLRSAIVETAGGRLSAEGRVGLDGDSATTLEVTARGLRAQDLLRAYAVDVPVVTFVDGQASLAGPGLDWRAWTSTVTLRLRAPTAASPGQLPLDGVARARLANGRWSAEANVATPEAAVVVATLDGDLGEDLAASTVSGHVRMDIDELAGFAHRVSGTAIDVAGRASVDARVSGTLSAPRAAWTLDASAATSTLAPVVVAAGGTATPDRLHASTFTLTSGANTVSADVTLGLSGARRLRGALTATLPDLGALLADPAALGWPLEGAAVASGTLGGTLTVPTARARVSMTNLAFAGQYVDQVATDVTAHGSRLEMADLTARTDDGRLSGTVAIDLAEGTHRAALALTDWPVNPVPAGTTATALPLSGRLTGTLDTMGPWTRPSGTAALEARDATWQGHVLSPLTLRAVADGARADLTFDAPDWRTTGRGSVRFTDGYPFDLTVSADALTLEPFRPWLPDVVLKANAAATATAEVAITGRATELEATAIATARLQALSVEMDDARLVIERPAVVVASKEAVRVDDLRLRSGDLLARVTGGLGRTSTDTPLTLTVTGAIGAVQPWLRAFAVQAPDIEGVIDLQATVAGTVDAPRPSARLTASDVTVALDEIPPGAARPGLATVRATRLAVRLDEGLVTLEPVLAEWQDARFTASGRLPLRLLAPHVDPAWHAWLGDAPGAAMLSARGDAIDAGLLAAFVPADSLSGVTGEVTAVLEMEAASATWAGLSGMLTLEEAAFTLAGIPLAQARPSVVRLDAGQLLVKDVLFSGPNTDLALDGDADLTLDVPTFELQLRGLTDLAILRPFLTDVVPAGRAEINLLASGTVGTPTLTGELMLTDASLRIAEPRLALELLNGTATFSGRQMSLPALRGIANGAPLTMSAALALATDNTVGGQVRLRATGLPVEYPKGLRTEADVDLIASIAGTRVDVTGDVDVLRGTYRDPIALSALTSGLLSSTPDGALVLDDDLPVDVRLDVRVQTRDDIVVDNNYGRFTAGGTVRLLGTLDEPGLSGRITLREGGELYLSGLTYRIERGAVDFANPTRIEPIVDLAAETQTRGERIRIEATGTPESLEVTLSAPDADVPLSQADLASLLVSGRSLDELTGAAAGEQALGLLSADLLGVVGRGVGLDALRLDRDLLIDDRTRTGDVDIAAETDPVARLTLAKRLRSNVEVVFSQNLRNASEITWLITWAPFRHTELRLLQRDDQSTSYEFRHEVAFGAPPRPARVRETPARVRRVEVVAADPVVTQGLERRLKLDPGDRFDFYRWQDDRDRLEAWMLSEGYYEHRVMARRTTIDGEDGPLVDLRYDVTPGPRARLEVVGVTLDGGVLERMREAWHGSVFDGFLQDDLAQLAREAMLDRGFPLASADVSTTTTPDGAEKTALVVIEPGPAVSRQLQVTGIEGTLARRFDDWLAAGPERLAWLDPSVFEGSARDWLRSRGALMVEVVVSELDRRNADAVRTVRVEGATPYLLARIETTGVPEVRRQTVRDELGLTPGDTYDALELSLARRNLERWYAAEGFRDAQVDVTTSARHDDDTIDLVVDVEEGARAVIVESRVEGGRLTQRALLDRALALPQGITATPQQLLSARKRLYDTGVLASVDVDAAPAGPVTETADGTLEQPVVVTGTVRELPRLRLRYGLAVNDDVLQDELVRVSESRRVTPGLSALLENRNLFGRAVTGGLSARYERARQSGRAFLTSPFLFGRDVRLLASAGMTRSWLVPDVKESARDVRTDVSLGVTQRLPGLEALRLTYGYRYERSRTSPYKPSEGDDFDTTIAAPRLTSTVFVDRRDDVTAATRGWFHASTVEVSRSWLASDFQFITYYGQQTAFRSIGSAVLAGRAQVGLGRGFAGEDLLDSERFVAGGAVSVRGYRERFVGDYNEVLELARGDGLLVLNGEVRMPLWRWISGVAFVDGGGVFPAVSDFGVRTLQWGTGAGVRVSTPAGLVRIDFGVPLDRRPIDKAWRVYVGLGHIF